MRVIKRFSGDTPPDLKKGEFATNGFNLYLGIGGGQSKVYQGILDLEEDQDILGFKMVNGTINIPAGTHFSQLQELFDTLPKNAMSSKYNSVRLNIDFEDGDYINDTGKWIQVRDINYTVFLSAKNKTSANTRNVSFVLEKSLEFYNCSGIQIQYINLKSSDSQGALFCNNTQLMLVQCTLEPTSEVQCLTPKNANVILHDCHIKMFNNQTQPITRNLIQGGKLTIYGTDSPVGNSPKSITDSCYGHVVIAGDVDRLNLLQSSIGSTYYGGGLEVADFTIL